MKDSSFLSGGVTSTLRNQVQEIAAYNSENFVELVRVAGLDPTRDFRYSNLDGVNFDNCDLRGYDFTGASLKGAIGQNVKWDETTILTDADVDASIFDPASTPGDEIAALPNSFLRQHWTSMVMWMDGLRQGSENYEEDARKLLLVFLQSDDTFVRRIAMQTLSRYVSQDFILRLIQRAVFDAGERRLINPAFALMKTMYQSEPGRVVKVALQQLSGPWAAEASIFLASNLTDRRAILRLVELMSRHQDGVARRRFVSALASQQGLATSTVVRNPLTGDVFDFRAIIPLPEVELIARRIVRLKRDEEGLAQTPITNAFPSRSVALIQRRILKRLHEFNRFGLKYAMPSFRIFDVQIGRASLLEEDAIIEADAFA